MTEKAASGEWVDYLCFNDACLGIGRWQVLVDAGGEPFDEQDAECPSCSDEGEPDAR